MRKTLAMMVAVGAVVVVAARPAAAEDTGAVYLVPGFLADTACEGSGCAHFVDYEISISEFGDTGIWIGWTNGVDSNTAYWAGAAALCWFSGWMTPHVEFIDPDLVELTGAGSACPQGDIVYLTSYLVDPDPGPI